MPLTLFGVRLMVRDGEEAAPKLVIFVTASLGDKQNDGKTPARDMAAQAVQKTHALQVAESIYICVRVCIHDAAFEK